VQAKSLLSAETTKRRQAGTYDHRWSPRFLLANRRDRKPRTSRSTEDDAAGDVLSAHRLAELSVPLFPTGRFVAHLAHAIATDRAVQRSAVAYLTATRDTADGPISRQPTQRDSPPD
jgi:hypothetical protein